MHTYNIFCRTVLYYDNAVSNLALSISLGGAGAVDITGDTAAEEALTSSDRNDIFTTPEPPPRTPC